MNIKTIAKQWLTDHNHDQNDLDSLIELIESVLDREDEGHYVSCANEIEYDPQFGDDKLCLCGDPYYRHFDTYDDMAPIGCKYCCHYGSDTQNELHGNGHCTGFKVKEIDDRTSSTIPDDDHIDDYDLRGGRF